MSSFKIVAGRPPFLDVEVVFGTSWKPPQLNKNRKRIAFYINILIVHVISGYHVYLRSHSRAYLHYERNTYTLKLQSPIPLSLPFRKCI